MSSVTERIVDVIDVVLGLTLIIREGKSRRTRDHRHLHIAEAGGVAAGVGEARHEAQ
jgi:hypothetical protein